MSSDLVIIPSDGDGYVELARTKTGRLFKKHILNKGDLIHPVTKEKIAIDDTFVATMKKNFTSGVCDIVQVPLANDNNEHTEDPDRNIGEVIGIEDSGDKVYALIDARTDHADKLGKTLLGASAMLHMNYTDTKTGEKVGPTLLHTCVTNRPYVTGLDNYEEIVGDVVAATNADKSQRAAVLLSADTVVVEPDSATAAAPPDTQPDQPPAQPAPTDRQPEETSVGDDTSKTTTETAEPTKPSLADLLTALKNDHGIDVTGLQAKAAEASKATELTSSLTKALTDSGLISLSNDTKAPSHEDVVSAVAELATTTVSLTSQVNALQRKDAEHAVDKLVESGHIMPKQRDGFVELKLTNTAMFEQLVPAEPVIKLNHEAGANEPDATAQTRNIDEEVARLAKLLNAK